MKEIAKLLQSDPTLKLYVVGAHRQPGWARHEHGLVASARRRGARRAHHPVRRSCSRLRASGCGPYSPVATNKTEEGRAKNRRVELVGQ